MLYIATEIGKQIFMDTAITARDSIRFTVIKNLFEHSFLFFRMTHSFHSSLFICMYMYNDAVDVGQMPMKLLLFFFHQILVSLLLTFRGQACLMETMLALVGMK